MSWLCPRVKRQQKNKLTDPATSANSAKCLLTVQLDDELLVNVRIYVVTLGQARNGNREVPPRSCQPARTATANGSRPRTLNMRILLRAVLDRDNITLLYLE